MDKTTLVDQDILAGASAIDALEAAGLPVAVAAWVSERDLTGWRLYVASPDVQKHGPTTVNRFVTSILEAANSPVSASDVLAVNSSNHFVNRMTDILPRITKGTGYRRLANSILDDKEIAEAFVYRAIQGLRPSKSPPKADKSTLERVRALAA